MFEASSEGKVEGREVDKAVKGFSLKSEKEVVVVTEHVIKEGDQNK